MLLVWIYVMMNGHQVTAEVIRGWLCLDLMYALLFRVYRASAMGIYHDVEFSVDLCSITSSLTPEAYACSA